PEIHGKNLRPHSTGRSNTNSPSYVPVGSIVEGNDDAEESGDNDTKVEESGDKESVAEKCSEQVGNSDPATTPEA
ncbi:hypothetical protein HAX54_017292, partial [Datura stramonium]|nr:hypothetical protein [Datura stramonium]